MYQRTKRLKELLSLLPSLGSRHGIHPGEGPQSESEWAARMIRNEFGLEAVQPLAATLSGWEAVDPDNCPMIRQLGFRDSETARRCRSQAIWAAAWCLREIPGAASRLLHDLSNQDAEVRVIAIQTLGLLQARDAVEPIIVLLADQDEGIAVAACLALKRITGKSFWFGRRDPAKWQTWWNKKKQRAQM